MTMTMTQQELVAEALRLAREATPAEATAEQRDEILETTMMRLLDAKVAVPYFGRVAKQAAGDTIKSSGLHLMHTEPRLPPMPEKPTLIDYFKRRVLLRDGGGNHLLQSAALARRNGLPDKLVLACLVHDLAVYCYIRTDHGYHSAALIEPYVDEEVAWAVRYHQVLRFYAEPAVGYEYPALYREWFGADYQPPEYARRAYEYARSHRWYMSARLVTANDLYAFDPNATVDVDSFADIIGRCFRQPAEGLGFDDSASAHMWRSIVWPNNFL